MRAVVMNGAGLFAPAAARTNPQTKSSTAVSAAAWNPEYFALEQIRGLVRQVFFPRAERNVRQVLFTAADTETDVNQLCRQVGEVLAAETENSVAVVGRHQPALESGTIGAHDRTEHPAGDGDPPLWDSAIKLRGNLWMVPHARGPEREGSSSSLHFFLGEMRREFEYSIVAGPPVGESNEAMTMAQVADGVILVLSAQHTRRVSAVKTKEMLERAQARVLGTVLSDRTFPIPEAIYRRL
jgi:hypothetical protein